MAEKTDLDLVQLIKGGDSLAVTELANKYENLCHATYFRYVGGSGSILPSIQDDKYFWIWKAAESYDETKGASFPTWLTWKLRTYYRNSYTKESKKELVSIFDESPVFIDNYSDCLESILKILEDFDDKRAKQIFLLRYGEKEMTFREIEKTMGISRTTAANIHKAAIEWIKTKIYENSF